LEASKDFPLPRDPALSGGNVLFGEGVVFVFPRHGRSSCCPYCCPTILRPPALVRKPSPPFHSVEIGVGLCSRGAPVIASPTHD
jgi:hypothetical protein